MMEAAPIGHNKPPLSKAELEQAFRERTRADRIKEHTPFDVRWQWEIFLSDLSANSIAVAYAIRLYAENNGTDSRPSIEALQFMTKLSRNTVLTAIKQIADANLMRKEVGAGRSRNVYVRMLPEQTLNELAVIFDIRSGSVIEPQAASVVVQPVNQKPVVVQMEDRSGSTTEPNITRDITTTLESARDARSLSKAVALGIAAAAGALPAAAAPMEPPAIIQPAKLSLSDMTDRMMDAAGAALANPAAYAGLLTYSELQRWLSNGCDLEGDILPAIRARCARASPGSIKSWRYFEEAVANEKAARQRPMSAGQSPNERSDDPPWKQKERARLDAFFKL